MKLCVCCGVCCLQLSTLLSLLTSRTKQPDRRRSISEASPRRLAAWLPTVPGSTTCWKAPRMPSNLSGPANGWLDPQHLEFVSRVFPGWTAHEIHTTLNELVLSCETDLVLERVGRELGCREGVSPEGDPSLARFGREKHAEGRVGGHAEGIVAMAAAPLRLRGIALSPDFPADLPREHQEALRRASAVAVAEAAHTAVCEDDFFVQLRKHG